MLTSTPSTFYIISLTFSFNLLTLSENSGPSFLSTTMFTMFYTSDSFSGQTHYLIVFISASISNSFRTYPNFSMRFCFSSAVKSDTFLFDIFSKNLKLFLSFYFEDRFKLFNTIFLEEILNSLIPLPTNKITRGVCLDMM